MRWRLKGGPLTWRCLGLGAVGLVIAACSLDQMATGSKLKPYAETEAFPDRQLARQPPFGTIPRPDDRHPVSTDELLDRGSENDRESDLFPFRISRTDILRGRERFDIYCAPCHGRTGSGDGMIVQRGYTAPPSYFTDRLRTAPAGHFVRVMRFGYGAMPSYSSLVAADDRWRIAAYIRALQLSRDMPAELLPPAIRRLLRPRGEGKAP